MKLNNARLVLGVFISFWVLCSCKKFVTVQAPNTSFNAENVFIDNATAAAALTGIYARISNENSDFSTLPDNICGITLYEGLQSDELTLFSQNSVTYLPYYTNDLTSTLSSGGIVWNTLYPTVYNANSAIEGLINSTSITNVVKNQLLGEAKFIRAFCYFYLVNLYGDVPLVLTTDWKLNSVIPKTDKALVYEQIINDLKDAESLLSKVYLKSDAQTAYSMGMEERVRPTQWAAAALLARTYLYTGDYANAEIQATVVIDNSNLFKLVSLNNVFLKNSSETIWSLQPVRSGTQANTGEGSMFVLPSTGPDGNDYPVYLSSDLANGFEFGDLRKSTWIDSVKPENLAYYFPKKYKIGKVDTTTEEYIMFLRLGEEYLIRAEARAQLGNISGAQFDLNMIRNRAGLSNTTANDKPSLVTAIAQERKFELFTEWGHRWFDLKRTKMIDSVMSIVTPKKGGTWKTYKALRPIAQDEMIKNPTLVQNSGY